MSTSNRHTLKGLRPWCTAAMCVERPVDRVKVLPHSSHRCDPAAADAVDDNGSCAAGNGGPLAAELPAPVVAKSSGSVNAVDDDGSCGGGGGVGDVVVCVGSLSDDDAAGAMPTK